MIDIFTHINWGGKYHIWISVDSIRVEVLEWGYLPNYPSQSDLWDKVEVLPIEDLVYFRLV